MSEWTGTCPWCGLKSNCSTMSFFSTTTVCCDCSDAERRHPAWEKAHDMEVAAVRGGDYNFGGVGLPAGFIAWIRKERGVEQTCPLENEWESWDAQKRADRIFMVCPACGHPGSHIKEMRGA